MSFKHLQDAQAGFLRILGEGDASTHEGRVATREFIRDNAIASAMPVLLDLCAMDDHVSGFELEPLIAYIDELQQTFQGKVAIVDARAGHATICCLAAASAKHPKQVRSFMQESAARAWLLSETPD